MIYNESCFCRFPLVPYHCPPFLISALNEMYYREKKGKNVKGLSYITSTLKIKILNDYYEKNNNNKKFHRVSVL